MNKLILFNEPVKSVRKSQQTIHSRIAKKKTGKYSMISGKNITLKMKKIKGGQAGEFFIVQIAHKYTKATNQLSCSSTGRAWR